MVAISKKISALTEMTTPAEDDLLAMVDYVANETKKIKVLNLGIGALGASAWVVADDANAYIKTCAEKLEALGWPVWVCDGVDDDVETQAAATAGAGGTINLSSGHFSFGDRVLVPSNTSIEAQGAGTIIKVGDAVNDIAFINENYDPVTIVTNGTFTGDTDWTKGTGWAITTVATKTAGVASSLSQPLTLVSGSQYVLYYKLTVTAGTIQPVFDDGAGNITYGQSMGASGTFIQFMEAPATGAVNISFNADAAFAGTLDNVIIYLGDHDITFRNFYLDGNNINQVEATTAAKYSSTITNQGLGAITLCGVIGFTIEHCVITRGIGSGIETLWSWHGGISRNTVSEGMDDNIAVNEDCAFVSIDHNTIFNNAHNWIKTGGSGCFEIEIQNSHDIDCGNNDIYRQFPDSNDSSRYGIGVNDHAGLNPSYNIEICDNTINSPGGTNGGAKLFYAIYVSTADTDPTGIIKGVTITGNTVTIDGNISNNSYCLVLGRCDGVTVTGNTFRYARWCVALLYGASSNVDIIGNTFVFNAGTTYSNVQIGVSTTNCKINNNVMTDGYYGIRILTGTTQTNLSIQDNTIYGAAQYVGIYFEASVTCVDCSITDNRISGTSAVIYQLPSSGVTGHGNVGYIFPGEIRTYSSSVADDGSIVLETGRAGFGKVIFGDNVEYSDFRFTSAGVVTLINNTANVVNTDTDTKYCVYDAGSGPAIKNRSGGTLTVTVQVTYQ